MYLSQVKLATIAKVTTVIINFVIVGVLYRALGVDKYGVYAALISVTTWMFLLDLGVAKGVRNIVTSALSRNDNVQVRIALATSYLFSFGMLISIVIITTLIYHYTDVLNSQDLNNKLILLIIYTSIVYFSFSTVDQVFHALHKSHLVFVNSLFVAALNILFLFLLLYFNELNLYNAVIAFSVAKISPYVCSNIFLFSRYSYTRFRLIDFNFKMLRLIIRHSLAIVTVQSLFLILIGFDRIILLGFASKIDVATYDIAYKYFSILMIPFGILMAPIWALITKFKTENDNDALESVFRKFYRLLIVVTFVIALMLNTFDVVAYYWLNEKLNVSFLSILYMGILFLLFMHGGFLTDVFFAFDRAVSLIIPLLAVLFIKYTFLGVTYNLGYFSLNNLILSSVFGYTSFVILAEYSRRNELKLERHNDIST